MAMYLLREPIFPIGYIADRADTMKKSQSATHLLLASDRLTLTAILIAVNLCSLMIASNVP